MLSRFFPQLAILGCLAAAGCVTQAERIAPSTPAEISGALETLLKEPVAPAGAAGGDEAGAPPLALRAFYAARAHAPLWVGPGGLSARGNALLAALGKAPEEGLRAEDYGTAGILSAVARTGDEGSASARVVRLAALELGLSEAYLAYAGDLSRGRVDPARAGAQWHIGRAPSDDDGLLRDAAGDEDPAAVLQRRLPRLPVYAALRGGLARYRRLAATGWPTIPAGVKLRRNDRGKAVTLLRARLAAEGYLASGAGGPSDRFDTALDEALRRFQARNGLDVDGVAGRDTVTALNVPASARADQIALNMERLRWLPRSLGGRYLLVDVPGFRLMVIDGDEVAFSSPVIVGRDDRPTPIFSATMNHVVFNPYWRVPRSIAVKDKLAEIRKEPKYFEEHQIEVFRYEKGGGTTQIDPSTVDWSSVTKDSFGYLFRQRPGAENALGRVKFMFPNPYSVYIHDTPSRYLFRRSKRTYSSGCIRVAEPIDLGVYLMAGNPGWNREKFMAAIEAGKTRTVHLKNRLPVHVIYLTAWAEDDGPVAFRRDIYKRDAALLLALKGAKPAVRVTAAPLPEAGP